MTVAVRLEGTSARRGAALAVADTGGELTHAEFTERAARVAAFLRDHDVTGGDRVGIHLGNSADFLAILVGVWRAGAVAVPFNVAVSGGALRHAVADSGALIAFVDEVGAARLAQHCPDQPMVRRTVLVGGADSVDVRAGAAWSFADVEATAPCDEIVPRAGSDDAILMYTSGSTGTPKGVRQTHRNVEAAVDATIAVWSLGDEDRAVVCTPFFHVGGLQLVALPMLLCGGSIYVLGAWSAGGWRRAVARWAATYTALVPTMVVDVVNEFGDAPVDLSCVRVCAIGGSVLPTDPVRRFVAATGVRSAVNIYGQTEQSGLAVCERPGEQDLPTSLGRPLDIVRWRLVEPETGREVTDLPGRIGELQVAGDAVTPGYWRLPEVDAERFVDGWFRTGDLLQRVGDELDYVERIDELIVTGGENVYPQMVENALASCPDIAEVAVIGTPHERWMQQVTAIVVPRTDAVTVESVRDYSAAHPDLRGPARPRRIEFVDALPRTGNNKIDRPALKRRFGGGR
ncbi:class I adenylate-forming enzyme family protein [Gordonia shandongensis]|uniref:class I adenylate-forming enzyme family protein n=1 Tax=Gordonia shandongensis TaxID=376351 RepID=UPI000426C1B2|nr:class I adenylate-forming enzyme family protein [Gordonia shandongensis]